jgi:hypothetical protein
MRPLPPDIQGQLDSHLQAIAQILYDHTETEKLQDFESIEVELREQLLTKITPPIGEFFSHTAAPAREANSGKLKVVSARSKSVRSKENA